MRTNNQNSSIGISNFAINGMMMRYSLFIPRLYNFCKLLGFETGKILPSRAFCSDESQGFPIILLTKHFGSFPFNHGQVGGIVATDRHGPHADHGKDMLIIQASHVGYDPATHKFGVYRRMQTENKQMSSNCGKVDSVINWYLTEYRFAQQNIWLHKEDSSVFITIDNQLLDPERKEGLFLNLQHLISSDNPVAVESLSTSKRFIISERFLEELIKSGVTFKQKQTISDHLDASIFYFKRELKGEIEDQLHLERNLLPQMSIVVTSKAPMLTAAMLNTQVEFERAFRTIVNNKNYLGKKVLFMSGLNIDISPEDEQAFPLTKFVPWAAYIQNEDGTGTTLEQKEIMEKLTAQSINNPDQIHLEDAINKMMDAKEVVVKLP